MCRNIFELASGMDKENWVRIFPFCHKKAGVDIYVSVKRREISLCCKKCDRPITTIRIPDEHKTTEPNAGTGH